MQAGVCPIDMAFRLDFAGRGNASCHFPNLYGFQTKGKIGVQQHGFQLKGLDEYACFTGQPRSDFRDASGQVPRWRVTGRTGCGGGHGLAGASGRSRRRDVVQ
jgi:hypothetical protein